MHCSVHVYMCSSVCTCTCVCTYYYVYRYKCVKDCYLFNKSRCWCFYHSLYCKYFLLKPLIISVSLCVRVWVSAREREREREGMYVRACVKC